jgi:SAM-dependent methyltransferase
MSPTTNTESYDAVPYAGMAHRDSHPSSIRPIATLLGLAPASPASCRVLEIGCAEGRNLLPMAAGLPGSRFVGLDLSERHVAVARASAEALGLRNVEFLVADIEVAGDALGTFDYIIAHGVYSWIPEGARRRLLALCGALLAPEGVAYVSHNVLPGWHRREALRRMMCFHVKGLEPVSEHVRASKELVDFLSAAAPDSDGLYRAWLEREAAFLADSDDFYVFHEHLAVHNDPSYFHEFMAEADQHGLQFVADAHLPSNFGKLLPAAVGEEVMRHSGRDRVRFEQYYDFVLNRAFRKTLLCQKDAPVAMPPRLHTWADAHVLCAFERAPDVEPEPGCSAWRCGDQLATDINPPTDALLEIIAARWPCSVPVGEVFEAYRALAADASEAHATLASFCERLYVPAVLELILVVAVPVVSGVGRGQPKLSAVARHQLEAGHEPLTTAHHTVLTLEAGTRALALLCDGSRSAAQIAAVLPPGWPKEAPPAGADGGAPPAVERVEAAVARLRYFGILD